MRARVHFMWDWVVCSKGTAAAKPTHMSARTTGKMMAGEVQPDQRCATALFAPRRNPRAHPQRRAGAGGHVPYEEPRPLGRGCCQQVAARVPGQARQRPRARGRAQP